MYRFITFRTTDSVLTGLRHTRYLHNFLQKYKIFFSRAQIGGTWTTLQCALGLLATPPSMFSKASTSQSVQNLVFHWSWSLLSRVLNMLNRTDYLAFIFFNYGLLSKVICASLWHACTLSAASSAWSSCVHIRPPSVQAVLSHPPSYTRNALTFLTAPTLSIGTSCEYALSTSEHRHMSSKITILLGK